MGKEPLLHQLQQLFSAALQDKYEANFGELNIESNLVRDTERFSIYQNAYFARFEESLSEDFPQVHQLLGEKIFSNLVKDYIIKHPSKYASLADVSLNFPNFLRDSDYIFPYPYLGDLADLDWLKNLSLLSEEIIAQDFSSWANLDYNLLQQKVLTLHPSVFFMHSKWNILTIEPSKIPMLKSTYLLINRKQSAVICREITENDWQIFIKMQKCITLDEIVRIFSSKNYAESDLSEWFNRWVILKVII